MNQLILHIFVFIVCIYSTTSARNVLVRQKIHHVEGLTMDGTINELKILTTLLITTGETRYRMNDFELVPNISYVNMKKKHVIIESKRRDQRGFTKYWLRLEVTVDCGKNNFAKYPFDSPKCVLNMTSFAQPKDELILEWASEDAVEIALDETMIPSLKLESQLQQTCEYEAFGIQFSCIQLVLTFSRRWGEVFAKMYEPLTTVVLFAYLALFLKDGTQRVTISSLSLIIAILMDTFNSYTRPQTGVVTAVDRWADICVAFCFISLLVVIVFESLRRRKDVILAEREERAFASGSSSIQEALITSLHNRLVLQQAKIAVWVKVIYPLAFFLMALSHALFIFVL